jgi:hypothetical protein
MKQALAGLIVLAAAGAALAQSPAPAPEKPAAQPPERRPLNLRLDDAGRFGVQGEPAEKDANNAANGLPGLGGGKPGTTQKSLEKTDVFPKDTNPNK